MARGNKAGMVDASEVIEDAQEEESGGGGSGESYLNLPDGVDRLDYEKGTQLLDIMPYEITVDNHPKAKRGKYWFERTIYVHFAIGPEEVNVLCPQTIAEPCPICKLQKRIYKDPQGDEDVAKALRAKRRELYNVIDTEEDEVVVQVLEISYYNFRERLKEDLAAASDDDPGVGGFSSLEDGRTLKIRWKESKIGKGKKATIFLEAGNIEFEERDEDYDESILEDVVNLDDILVVKEYDALEALLEGAEVGGGEPAEEEEEEEEEPKKKKKGKKSSKKKNREDDEVPEGVCIACEGSGKNRQGRNCRICEGSGEDTTGPSEEEPKKKSSKKSSKKKSSKKSDGWEDEDDD